MVINTDPSSQQHTIVVVCIVCPVVTSLFVAIRVWTRTFISHWIGWDDCKLTTSPFPSGLALTHYRCCFGYLGKYFLLLAFAYCSPTHEIETALLYSLQRSDWIRCFLSLFYKLIAHQV